MKIIRSSTYRLWNFALNYITKKYLECYRDNLVLKQNNKILNEKISSIEEYNDYNNYNAFDLGQEEMKLNIKYQGF